jgi:hypothetical protein
MGAIPLLSLRQGILSQDSSSFPLLGVTNSTVKRNPTLLTSCEVKVSFIPYPFHNFTGITVRLASKVEVDWDASRLFKPYRSSRNEDVSFHSHCQIMLNREGDKLNIHDGYFEV